MTTRNFKRVHGLGVLRLSDSTRRPVRYGLTSYEQGRANEPSTDMVLHGHIEADDEASIPAFEDPDATLELADGRLLEIVLQRPERSAFGWLAFTVKA
jgi:hypothetical protein